MNKIKIVNKIEDLEKIRGKLIDSTISFSTPQYILIEKELRDRCIKIKKEFGRRYKKTNLFYSYKTNTIPYVVKLIHATGIGAEVCSLFELQLALKLKEKNIIFNSSSKTDEEIAFAIRNLDKVTIIIDSLSEFAKISKLTKDLKRKISIGVRVDTGIYKSRNFTGFGMKEKDVLFLFKKSNENPYLNISGLHFHAGSELKEPSLYAKNLRTIGKLIRKINQEQRTQIQFVDVGGGIGVSGYAPLSLPEVALKFVGNKFSQNWGNGEYNIDPVAPISNFAEVITENFKNHILSIHHVNEPKLYVEPGRWLVNPAIHLLTKVFYKKPGNVIILDGGRTLAIFLNREFHVVLNLTNPSVERQIGRLFGPLGVDDHVGNVYYGNELKEGDVVCISDVGAYSCSTAMQYIKPLPKCVSLTKGGKLKEIRREETFEYRFGRDRY